jgi:hypothetical protein
VTEKKDIKEKIKKIYDVLPKLDDRRCGHRTCGEFARAVAEGRAPCHGCVSGGPQVAAKVCEIVGVKIPQKPIAQFGPGAGLHQPGLSVGRARARGGGRGPHRGGRGMGSRYGIRFGGMGRGFGGGRRRE